MQTSLHQLGVDRCGEQSDDTRGLVTLSARWRLATARREVLYILT